MNELGVTRAAWPQHHRGLGNGQVEGVQFKGGGSILPIWW